MLPVYPGPTLKATGTIAPCTAVKGDVATDFGCLQATAATDPVIGVSQEGQKGTPGITGSDTTIAAESGDPIQVYVFGTALVKLGGTVAAYDYLEPTTGGAVIASATTGWRRVVGWALEDGTSGQYVKCWVQPMQIHNP